MTISTRVIPWMPTWPRQPRPLVYLSSPRAKSSSSLARCGGSWGNAEAHHGHALSPTLAGHRVRLEVGHRDELERRCVRRLEDDRRRDARLERFLPAQSDHAPAVARP